MYKLIDTVNGYYYIGSTCMPLRKRLSSHKSFANIKSEQKVYKYFNYVGWDNVKIILHSEHYLDNKEQLLREEDNVIQMHLDDTKCLNSRRSLIEINKKEYHKEYREKNKEHIQQQKKEYMKEYYEQMKQKIKCMCGSTIQKKTIKTHEKTNKHINYINNLSQCAETI